MSYLYQRNAVHVAAAKIAQATSHNQIKRLLDTLADDYERDAAMQIAARRYATTVLGGFERVEKAKNANGTDKCKNGIRIPGLHTALDNDDIYFADNALLASVMRKAPRVKNAEGAAFKPGSVMLPRLPSTIKQNADLRQKLWEGHIWTHPMNVARLQKNNGNLWHDASQGVLDYRVLLVVNALPFTAALKDHMKSRQRFATSRRQVVGAERRLKKEAEKFYRASARRMERMSKRLEKDSDTAYKQGNSAAAARSKRKVDLENCCQPGGPGRMDR